MDELSNRLRTAPKQAAPHRDPWPGVEARIRTRPAPQWRRAAAAAALFVAGTLTGVGLERRDSSDRSAAQANAGAPLYVAAAVQRAGSEYLAAVAALRGLTPGDEPLRAQGYEAAIAVMAASAEEVTAALDLREHAALAAHAVAARRAASRRTAALVAGGPE